MNNELFPVSELKVTMGNHVIIRLKSLSFRSLVTEQYNNLPVTGSVYPYYNGKIKNKKKTTKAVVIKETLQRKYLQCAFRKYKYDRGYKS